MSADDVGRSGFAGLIERLADGWALLGGLLLVVVVLMNVASVVGGVVAAPFPGDFELTQVGVAVAAFAFLPFCQMTGANVSADIFTEKAGRRWIAVFRTAASAAALGVAALLLWRMTAGMLSQREYGYVTAIVQFPVWAAFLPILASLALLCLTAVVTLGEAFRAVLTGETA